MIKKTFLLLTLLCLITHSQAQVGINTISPQAQLDINSFDTGFLIPQIALTGLDDVTTVVNPQGGSIAEATLVYNTATTGTTPFDITPGFYVWSGTQWVSAWDAQWLKANSLNKSTGINDNIYTLGKVGINNDQPVYPLDVNGSVRLPRDMSFYISDGSLDANNGLRLMFSNRVEWFNRGAKTFWRTSDLNIGTGTENRVLTTLNGSGFVSVGEGDPTQNLHVVQGNLMLETDRGFHFDRLNQNTDMIQFVRTDDVPNQVSTLQLFIGDNDGGPSADALVIGARDIDVTPQVFRGAIEFRANGVASKASAGSWSTLSDRRVKKQIKPFSDGLEKIIKIAPVSFQYNGKAGTENNGNTYTGVIAQEVASIAPYLVTQVPNSEISDLLSYDATPVDYMLVNAIKTLSRKSETIKTRLEKVQQRLLKIQEQITVAETSGEPAEAITRVSE